MPSCTALANFTYHHSAAVDPAAHRRAGRIRVISFNAKTSTDEQKKHDDFVDRMMEKGYTRKQVR
jgi:hypothetical protein